MAVHRPPQTSGRFRKLLLIVLPLLVLGGGLAALLLTDLEPAVALDADLCPVGHSELPRAAFLVDLRKPLGASGATLATDALRDVTLALPAGAELRVYNLTENATAPRQFIRRFCKPYSNAALATTSAKEDRTQTRDCDDLPAQVSGNVRENAKRFCAVRAEVAADLERLVARPLALPVLNAYLVEAIEETILAFDDLPGQPRLFYLFSDMMQHAAWYSHMERGQTGWGFNDFLYQREMEVSSVGPRPAPLKDVDVTVFYLPRRGLTDMPRPKMTHTAFWHRYFADAMGREPVVREFPTADSYEVEPLTNRLSAAEQLAEERRRLEFERQKLEDAIERDADLRRAEARAEAERLAEIERQRAEAERLAEEQRLAEEEERARAEREPAAEVADAGPEDAEPPSPIDPPLVEPVASAADDAPSQDAPAAQDAVAQAVEPPRQDPQPAEPATPDPALPDTAAVDPQTDAEAICASTLMPEYRNTDAYPRGRRINFGSATIVLQFVLNEQGGISDDTVEVIADSSAATRPQYFDIFANEARALARQWRFEFAAGETNCSRRQIKRATVEFRF